jgi:hypothetical protein
MFATNGCIGLQQRLSLLFMMFSTIMNDRYRWVIDRIVFGEKLKGKRKNEGCELHEYDLNR